MCIWKIDIYANKDDQNAVCCTALVRGDTVEQALKLAADKAKTYALHSDRLRLKSCGLASNYRTQGQLEEDEDFRLIILG